MTAGEHSLTITVQQHRVAKAVISVAGKEEELEVLVAEQHPHAALLGRDMPGIWDLGKRLLHDKLVNMVTTRSHKADLEETSLPSEYKEGRTEDLTDEESSEGETAALGEHTR